MARCACLIRQPLRTDVNEKLKKLCHWFILNKLMPGFMNSGQLAKSNPRVGVITSLFSG